MRSTSKKNKHFSGCTENGRHKRSNTVSEISRHLDSTWPSQGLHPKFFGAAEIATLVVIVGVPVCAAMMKKSSRILWFSIWVSKKVSVSVETHKMVFTHHRGSCLCIHWWKKSSGKFWFSIWVLKKVSVSTKTHKMLLKPAFGYWRKF